MEREKKGVWLVAVMFLSVPGGAKSVYQWQLSCHLILELTTFEPFPADKWGELFAPTMLLWKGLCVPLTNDAWTTADISAD